MTDSLQDSRVTSLLITDGRPLPAARRLVVLVASPDTPYDLAREVWNLAAPHRLDVLFVALTRRRSERGVLQRLLVSLAAVTRDDHVPVETHLQERGSWLQTVQAVWRPGDLIVCQDGQTVYQWGWRRQELALTLALTLQTPVYVLPNFQRSWSSKPAAPLGKFLRSLIPLLIIAAFFLIQVQIEQMPKNAGYYSVAILTVFVEIILLYFWFSFFAD